MVEATSTSTPTSTSKSRATEANTATAACLSPDTNHICHASHPFSSSSDRIPDCRPRVVFSELGASALRHMPSRYWGRWTISVLGLLLVVHTVVVRLRRRQRCCLRRRPMRPRNKTHEPNSNGGDARESRSDEDSDDNGNSDSNSDSGFDDSDNHGNRRYGIRADGEDHGNESGTDADADAHSDGDEDRNIVPALVMEPPTTVTIAVRPGAPPL